MAESQFRVIIIGGSIGGLTLAHCLHHAGIDHVVLEKSRDPAPQVGASIGILPNGARVLDQLHLFDAVEDITEPLDTATIRYADGFSFSSTYPQIINERCVVSNSLVLEITIADIAPVLKKKIRIPCRISRPTKTTGDPV